MKVLNLYSGLGINRMFWEDVEVTAVENNEEIARAYQDSYPNDRVIVGDAPSYLLEHFQEFDFIWISHPCQRNSRARYWGWSSRNPVYPDFGLYEEIVFLQHHFDGKFVSENVKAYHEPLIPVTAEIGRHWFWANFRIGKFKPSYEIDIHTAGKKPYEEAYGVCLDGYDIERKDRKLRNGVHPEIGNYILNCAREIYESPNPEQMTMFEADDYR